MKKLLSILLCLALVAGFFPQTVYAAPEWPSGVSIQAEGGIVIDADSGAILWGKNIHNPYYPASITKIMTALLVLERCKLDDIVTFSHNAVYNVESDSSNASISEGDQLSVRECLYALLLKSANEAANALAEHVSGSTEAFAVLMNQKAMELGCTDTHFSNPSGLNDEEHYTSAYDMSLIAKAAFSIPEFVEIVSTTYHVLTPTKIEPEGLAISPGHKMIKKNSGYYYPGVIGGKTGYTTKAGNTLVTCAKRDSMTLITVVLKGSQPQYYKDTKALLDFGFHNFNTLKITDYETTYSPLEDDMIIGGLSIDKPEAVILDEASRITLPKNAEFSDTSSELTYDLAPEDPKSAVAKVSYEYYGRKVGTLYLTVNPELSQPPAPPEDLPLPSETATEPETTTEAAIVPSTALVIARGDPDAESSPPAGNQESSPLDKKPFRVPPAVWTGLLVVAALAAVIGGIAALKFRISLREEEERRQRREKRLQRLRDAGYSSADFDVVMEQRHSSKKRGGRRLKFK